jgi:AcrR family transcriptional regulator
MMRRSKKVGRKEVKGPGRPLAFDPGQALERAMGVFWRRGYEGASLAELTRAMRINRPSMYATFGNKERLFRKVLDRYAHDAVGYLRDGLREPTARGAMEKILLDAADALSDPSRPPGCLLVQGALACGSESNRIQRELCSRRGEGEAAIRQRFERAQAQGDLPSSVDTAALAAYLAAVLNGLAVQAASGASREKLRTIAQRAMQAWPAS